MARAREQIPRLDGPVFPSSQDRRDLSFGGGGPVCPFTCPAKGKLCGETRLPMVMRIAEWVSITALLLVVSWRPFASYQIPLDLVVCWGALVGVLALFLHQTRNGDTL